MAPSLIASVLCLALWAVLVFVRPVGLGVVHVLLGVGAVLLIRWYALRPLKRGAGSGEQ